LVLLVDSDDESRDDDERVLRHAGYRVESVPSGLHAQQILDREEVALVVTEQVMIGVDGLSLLTFIRKRTPRVRRVLATRRPSGELVMRARVEAGARTLLRPIKPEKLLSVVRQELDAYRS
jgi:DNA-binding NtrC family response regulator